MAVHSRITLLTILLGLGGALLAACSSEDADRAERRPGGSDTAGLPVPDASRGGVTGMPDRPGPGAIGTPDPSQVLPLDDQVLASPGAIDELGNPPLDHDPDRIVDQGDTAMLPPALAGEATAQDAVAVIREYYAALDSGNFPQAYRLWSQEGAATGQSLQQFADSFGGAATRRVDLMSPGRIDAAAGSRYIEVPLAIEETGRDGRVHRYAGAYTLRRAVVDGASTEQRAWRISAADLREVRP